MLFPRAEMFFKLMLAKYWDDSTDFRSTLGQPTLLPEITEITVRFTGKQLSNLVQNFTLIIKNKLLCCALYNNLFNEVWVSKIEQDKNL